MNDATPTGKNIIAGNPEAGSGAAVQGMNPATGQVLEPTYRSASADMVTRAVRAATEAFRADRNRPAEDRARLLEAIADQIEALGDTLVERVMAETGLPDGRVRGERGRTTGQLRLFAGVVREGSWVDARIDTALPDRQPIPKPDIRSLLRPIGPVAVFGASNFPLAFSVAGGDTASALASGCPVVCKAHPAHPGTSELIGRAIAAAVQETGFHAGTFSLLHGGGPEVGMAMVTAPGIKAVGFTGSLTGGKALFDAAANRPEPIPVFAEMGSVNPVFILPGALKDRGNAIAQGLAGSVTLGSGQFCTNPGLVFVVDAPELVSFRAALATAITAMSGQTMLHAGIRDGFEKGVARVAGAVGVETLAQAATPGSGHADAVAQPRIFETTSARFRANPDLHHEVFGPASILIVCDSLDDLRETASALEGNLTGTVHATDVDLNGSQSLFDLLEDRVGRIIVNGFPTGVEVCPAMHHGGPYPATTDARWTSVGTAAIRRFARPVCYQDVPEALLPQAVRNDNPNGATRIINGTYTRESL